MYCRFGSLPLSVPQPHEGGKVEGRISLVGVACVGGCQVRLCERGVVLLQIEQQMSDILRKKGW